MSNLPETIIEVLKADPTFAGIKDWQAVNGLITLKDPGISVGLEKEDFEPDTRAADNCNATCKLVTWLRMKDPAAGEAAIRELAHQIRFCLNRHRSLGGIVDGLMVSRIEYLTADAGQGLLLHLADITIDIQYTAERLLKEASSGVQTINYDIGSE